MKRYFIILIALLAIATGASAAATDYGFLIGGYGRVTSRNCAEQSGRVWWYDPSTNVLHLKSGTLRFDYTEEDPYRGAIYVDVNTSLTIQVDGDCTITGNHAKSIFYNIAGNHTICGNGKLTISPLSVGSTGITADKATNLTIKDLDLAINVDGSTSIPFNGLHFGSVTLNDCHISASSLNGAWVAWEYSAKPVLENCYLVAGCFVGGGIRVSSDPQSVFMKRIEIRRCRYVNKVDVTIASPTIGVALASTAKDNEKNVAVNKVQWFETGSTSPLDQGYIAKLGETYRAYITLGTINTISIDYLFSSGTIVTINGTRVSVGSPTINTINVSYTFPQLTAPCNNLSFTVDQPAVGQPLYKTAVAGNEAYSMVSMGWQIDMGDIGWREVADGYVCSLGDVMRVVINAKLSNGYVFPADGKATVNGRPAEVTSGYGDIKQITCTFPQLTDIYYDLWIGGKRVKYSNLGDILGNGIFAYTPSSKTLKVKGSFSSSLNAPLIESSIDGLIIDVMQDAVLEASSTNGNQVFWLKDGTTTMKGMGKLTLKSLYETGIYLTNSASVVIDNMNMVIDAYWGIAGPPSGQKQEKLTIKSSNIVITTGSSTSNGLAAICDLQGGIVLQGCSITSPNGYNISNGSVYNNGNWAREVTITVDGGISTDIDAIDNGQLTMDKSLPLYNLNGQRVSHPVKGQIYIQNGRKIKF